MFAFFRPRYVPARGASRRAFLRASLVVFLMAGGLSASLLASGTPNIIGLRVQYGRGYYAVLEGYIIENNLPLGNALVTFGGLPEVNGKTTTTDTNGSFQLGVQFQPNEKGDVSVQGTDGAGLQTGLSWIYINVGTNGGGGGGGG